MPFVEGTIFAASSGVKLDVMPDWLGLELSVESDAVELGVGGVWAPSRVLSEFSLLDLTWSQKVKH